MENFFSNSGILLENFTTCDEIKYRTPATKRIATNKEMDIATILFIFFFKRIFTKGFSRIAIMSANANGTRILLNSKSINTKSMIPKSVTVDLKKKGYFLCINKLIVHF